MYSKLIIAKTKFFMTNEERKQLSMDMADMALNGALVIGSEIEQLIILDVNTGKVVPIKAKEETHVESESPEDTKKYSSKDLIEIVKKIFSKKPEKKESPAKKYY